MANPIAEINLKNLSHNCTYIKSIVGNSMIFPVLKANAYGHGVEKTAQFLNNLDIINGFCVATENEAEELIRFKIDKPIFILGKTNLLNTKLLSKKNIIPTIHSLDEIKQLKSILSNGFKVKFQIKIDTGMGRLGLDLKESIKVIHYIKNNSVNLIGCWSHFSSANEDNQDYTNLQINRFSSFLDRLKKKKINFKYIHMANSSAILQNRNSYFNTVRPGLSIYGISPLGKLNPNLKPVMKFKLPLIKKINKSAGEYIGYNRKYQTQKNEKIGIFQGGYADGIGSFFGNHGKIQIKHNLHPIRGKISMDLTAVDITGSNIELNEYATIWGQDELVLENISKNYNKIPYEFLVNLSDRVERHYIE
ncbi:MAG: alanine racemase [Candidatus Marinimicrobia bacterium]|nr:alanine racemase [Candidatus Neomarinimicrobiota bacterium]|tara:strand:- start:5945 stop:7033 length:1089 start_codon:yes stop_codon:yes gene_type:complete